MTENGEIVARKRRSSEEVQRLVREFESSGLGQNEFCRKEGLALSTLPRQLKKRRVSKCEPVAGSGLVRVELAGRSVFMDVEQLRMGNCWPSVIVLALSRNDC